MSILKLNIKKLEDLYFQISKYDKTISEYHDFLMQPTIPGPTRVHYKNEIARLEIERNEINEKCIKIICSASNYPDKLLYSKLRSSISEDFYFDLDNLIGNYADSVFKASEFTKDDLNLIPKVIDELDKTKFYEKIEASQSIKEELNKAKEKILENDLSLINKLRLTIPIVPFLLSYQTEISLSNKLKLNSLWDKLKRKKNEL